jgi:hypothetical protein
MSRQCAFCPATSNFTGEHLWSNWINAVLPPTIRCSFKRVDTQSKKESVFTKEELSLTANVVCEECNSGWMSRVDSQEAKPSLKYLISDASPRVISIRKLISIAIFLFKTAVVADHMGTGGTPYFTVQERYTFRETLSIPAGVSMWIGALEDSARGTFTTAHVNPVAAGETDFGLFVFTYIVGHLVLQIVGAKWATHNPNRSYFPPIQRDEDSRFMSPFWPIGGSIRWPPPQYMPVTLLSDLTNRWRTYNIV